MFLDQPSLFLSCLKRENQMSPGLSSLKTAWRHHIFRHYYQKKMYIQIDFFSTCPTSRYHFKYKKLQKFNCYIQVRTWCTQPPHRVRIHTNVFCLILNRIIRSVEIFHKASIPPTCSRVIYTQPSCETCNWLSQLTQHFSS